MTHGRTSGVARGRGATPIGTGRGSLRVTRAVPPQREAQTLNKNNHTSSLTWRRIIDGGSSAPPRRLEATTLTAVVSGGDAAAEEHAGAPARLHRLQRRTLLRAPKAEQTGGTDLLEARAEVPAAHLEGKFTVVPLLREPCNASSTSPCMKRLGCEIARYAMRCNSCI